MALLQFIPLTSAPKSSEDALVSLERELEAANDQFYLERVRAGLKVLREGSGEGAVALSGRSFAAAVVLWRRKPLGIIELHTLYLEPSLRSVDGWSSLLKETSELVASQGRVAFCWAPLLGVTVDDEARILRSFGMEPFTRYEMRFPTTSPIPDPSSVDRFHLRTTVPADEARLARLHERAYARSLDRYLFLEDADPRKESDEHIRGLLAGKYGEFHGWASHVAERDDRLAGAVLVVDWSGALLVEVMTDPDFKGMGIATELVRRSLRSLREAGREPPRLNVTGENLRAFSLYGRLGFVVTLGPEVGWFNRTVLGL